MSLSIRDLYSPVPSQKGLSNNDIITLEGMPCQYPTICSGKSDIVYSLINLVSTLPCTDVGSSKTYIVGATLAVALLTFAVALYALRVCTFTGRKNLVE
jgi:hypothetical protein